MNLNFHQILFLSNPVNFKHPVVREESGLWGAVKLWAKNTLCQWQQCTPQPTTYFIKKSKKNWIKLTTINIWHGCELFSHMQMHRFPHTFYGYFHTCFIFCILSYGFLGGLKISRRQLWQQKRSWLSSIGDMEGCIKLILTLGNSPQLPTVQLIIYLSHLCFQWHTSLLTSSLT